MSSSRFRRVALALPGAAEGAHQRTADFRVGKRIFATLGYPDDAWGMVKLTQAQQSMLVDAEPEIFRPVPGGWGKQGYTNVHFAKAGATTHATLSHRCGPGARASAGGPRIERARRIARSGARHRRLRAARRNAGPKPPREVARRAEAVAPTAGLPRQRPRAH